METYLCKNLLFFQHHCLTVDCGSMWYIFHLTMNAHFIPNEDPHNILRGMLVNVPQPVCHIGEAFLVCYIVDQHDTHSLPKEKI